MTVGELIEELEKHSRTLPVGTWAYHLHEVIRVEEDTEPVDSGVYRNVVILGVEV